MYESSVLNVALAIMLLLFVATFVSYFVRKTRLPYTVVLVLVGGLIAFAAHRIPGIAFLDTFRISPEIVFYVFLPTLIFESAFHMRFRHFEENKVSIVALSTFGLMISAFIVAGLMTYFLDIPFINSLLFGVLISSTDPISVLSLFKRLGVSKRLSTIVEGESLFNDGTALVIFGIILEFAVGDNMVIDQATVLSTVGNFAYVVVMGVLVGVVMGVFFSKALDYVQNSKEIEISMTLILAHTTFIVAEYFLDASGILATVAAGIIVGNYGYYKISYDVREIMNHFWDYASFIANSLLFLMVGSLIYSLQNDIFELFVPTLYVVLFVVIARFLMVYSVVPLVNLLSKEKISLRWMHVINWSGLRGALAIALVLTLPDTFPYFREMLVFTVGVIFFTVVVYGFSMAPLLTWLGLKNLTPRENFEHNENLLLKNKKVDEKLHLMLKKKFISKDVYTVVSQEYKDSCVNCELNIKELFSGVDKLDDEKVATVLHRHLLGIERHIFTKLYYHREITQDLLNVLLRNLQKQTVNLNEDVRITFGVLLQINPNGVLFSFLERLGFKGIKQRMEKRELELRYEMYRARVIASEEVLIKLKDFEKTNIFISPKVIKRFELKYQRWHNNGQKKLKHLETNYPELCYAVQCFLAKQAAFHVEDKVLQELRVTGMANAKVYSLLADDLEKRRGSVKF